MAKTNKIQKDHGMNVRDEERFSKSNDYFEWCAKLKVHIAPFQVIACSS